MKSKLISWANEENEIVADYHKMSRTIYGGKNATEKDLTEFKEWLEKEDYEVAAVFNSNKKGNDVKK